MIQEFKGEHRYLSNFYPCQIEIDGVVYPSSEHAYMCFKTDDIKQRNQILACATPAEAKRLGRWVTLRPDWDSIKNQVMENVLFNKFHQNPDLLAKLLATGDQLLVEGNYWGDTYWGVCLKTNNGHNHLGKTLMAIRNALKQEKSVSNNVIIAGGRDFNDRALMIDRIQELEKQGLIYATTTLICGMANGADLMAREIFKQAGLNVRDMPAEWDLLGKRAGYARNEAMACIADMALVFWDGQSKGSKHMIDTMDKLGKPVYVVGY